MSRAALARLSVLPTPLVLPQAHEGNLTLGQAAEPQRSAISVI
jgi:hypothetical protein